MARAVRLALIGRVASDPATPEQEEARDVLFRERAFPEGRAMPVAALTPDLGIDPHAAAESLRESLARLEAFEGPWPIHRILGSADGSASVASASGSQPIAVSADRAGRGAVSYRGRCTLYAATRPSEQLDCARNVIQDITRTPWYDTTSRLPGPVCPHARAERSPK